MIEPERRRIMKLQTFKRYEKKFMITSEQRDALINRLGGLFELDGYCKSGVYKICNIYFDTHNNDIIRHSTSKPYYKEKLRLRSYGTPQSDDATVFLELKKKIGGIVNKRRAILSYGQAKSYLHDGTRPEGLDYLGNQVLSEIDWFLKNNDVKPAAYISYDRTAMFSKTDKCLRLTFDTNIRTRRTDLELSKGTHGTELLSAETCLMELKFSGAIPLEIAHILTELKIFSHGFSKIGTEFKGYLRGCYEEELDNATI